MRFIEFGDKKNPTIVLIHGYSVSWKMWKPHIDLLQKYYLLIVPILDGHDEENDSIFISVEKSAKDISDYIQTYYDGSIFALCGASLGGTIGLEVLAQNSIKIQKAIIDAGPAAPFSKLFTILAIKGRILQNRLIRKDIKLIKKAMYKSPYPKEVIEDSIKMCLRMSDETCKNVQISCFTYNLPLSIKDNKADIAYWYGSKEGRIYKKSLKRISQVLPDAEIEMFKGYNHGELCIADSQHFIEKALKFFKR